MSFDIILQHAHRVMQDLGIGHREAIYAKALNVSLNKYQIPHRSEVDIPILFDGECVGHGRADLIVGNVLVEIKALNNPPKDALAQLRKYVSNLSLVEKKRYQGVVLNFCQKTGNVSIFMQHEDKPPAIRRKAVMPPIPVKSRFFIKKKK